MVPNVFLLFRKLLDGVIFDHIKFAAHNGFDALLGGLGHKLEYAKHIAVVGNSHGGQIVLFSLLNQLFNVSLPVEQRVLGVAVEVRELHRASGF